MTMRRIVISEFMDERAVERLKATHDVLYDPALVDDPLRLLSECVSADALIVRNRTEVRGELLDALRRCKAVGRLGVGLDNIDVPGCEAMGLRVIPATGANAASVAEYVIAAAMLLLRGAYASSTDVAAGRWPRAALSGGREIAGKALGLVGHGSIGQLVAQKAAVLGMQVLVSLSSRAPQAIPLDELIARSDVVSLHVPLTEGTRGLFDAARIASMKRGAVLINTARGGIVDEAALAAALRSGALGGAALDVFEREPLPHAPHFEGCPNLLLTPHIAGVTLESNERVSFMIADEVLKALA